MLKDHFHKFLTKLCASSRTLTEFYVYDFIDITYNHEETLTNFWCYSLNVNLAS